MHSYQHHLLHHFSAHSHHCCLSQTLLTNQKPKRNAEFQFCFIIASSFVHSSFKIYLNWSIQCLPSLIWVVIQTFPYVHRMLTMGGWQHMPIICGKILTIHQIMKCQVPLQQCNHIFSLKFPLQSYTVKQHSSMYPSSYHQQYTHWSDV